MSTLAYLVPFAVLVVILVRLALPRRSIRFSHLRGATLREESHVATLLQGARSKSDPGIAIGKHRFPSLTASQHLVYVGATGSGKTILQRLLMQSVLPQLTATSRALIYDAKRDVMSVLGGMKLPCPVHLLNPMDARGVAWDLAADITTAPAAHQLARILIPVNDRDQNRFFPDAARSLLEAVFLFLIREHPGAWSLREALLLIRCPETLQQVVAASSDTHDLLNLFEYRPTLQNIMAAVVTYLRPYQLIAAAWDKAPHKLSLTHWMNSRSILVLGNDESNRSAVDTLHRVVFSRIAELILSSSENQNRSTWIFLDEVREAQKLDKLSQLLTQGRSKGAKVVLGFQDIEGLRHVYTDKVANELVGQCATKVVLRLNSPETAAWASRVLGKEEVLESRLGTSSSRQSDRALSQTVGQSTSFGISQRPLVMESELTELPETSFEKGLTAYVKHPLTGPFKTYLPPDFLKAQLLSKDSTIPDLLPINPAHWFLNPLSSQELRTLLRKPDPAPSAQVDLEFEPLGTRPPSLGCERNRQELNHT
jgi:type IV secretory pathway TraG/TraD family ATPase VirD4